MALYIYTALYNFLEGFYAVMQKNDIIKTTATTGILEAVIADVMLTRRNCKGRDELYIIVLRWGCGVHHQKYIYTKYEKTI